MARDISLQLYDKMLGRTGGVGENLPLQLPAIADVLRMARAGSLAGDVPSWIYLAYRFYGHPSLRLSWKQASSGDFSGS